MPTHEEGSNVSRELLFRLQKMRTAAEARSPLKPYRERLEPEPPLTAPSHRHRPLCGGYSGKAAEALVPDKLGMCVSDLSMAINALQSADVVLNDPDSRDKLAEAMRLARMVRDRIQS